MRPGGLSPERCPHREVTAVVPAPREGAAPDRRDPLIWLVGVCRECGARLKRPAHTRPVGPWQVAPDRSDAA